MRLVFLISSFFIEKNQINFVFLLFFLILRYSMQTNRNVVAKFLLINKYLKRPHIACYDINSYKFS